MWNQWAAGPPPMPPPSAANNPQPPLIGPVQPNEVVAPPPIVTGSSAVQPGSYTAPSGAPSYTPAQYAAMTPEQQYAVQQHWQQWQAYEQQYAQWHAQYGEQYKREMAAIHSGPPPTVSQYGSVSVSNSYAYPPPAAVSAPYQAPPAPVNAPPPPPPDDKMNPLGVKALPQIYEQPPPPPPPPVQEETTPNKSGVIAPIQDSQPEQIKTSQVFQNQNNNWSQPPPPSQNQGNRWNAPTIEQPNIFNQQGNQFGQQSRQQQNQFSHQARQQPNQFGQQERPPPNQFPQQQNQFGQQDRQQQNSFGQQDRPQQNLFSQQDRQQPNSFGQQGQQQNQFSQQFQNQRGRQNFGNSGWERQGNRQGNEDYGRNNNRFGNNIDNNSQPQFNEFEQRNNRPQQQWQQSDGNMQRNNESFSNNRFDNTRNNFNSNLGQTNNPQGSGWNNSNEGNNFAMSENQKQQQNLTTQSTSQNNTKPINSSSVDEKAFDEQFRLWEEQFEKWKKENANHPDRKMYMQYEKEFEKTRVRLLERREQMRRRKMLEMQQTSNQETIVKEVDEPKQLQQQQSQPPPILQPPQYQEQSQQLHQPLLQQQSQQPQQPQQPQQQQHQEQPNNEACLPNQDKLDVDKINPNANVTKEKLEGGSDMEQSDSEDAPDTSEKTEQSKNSPGETPMENINPSETNIFQKQEITELFKPTGGIPGLDLVGSKDIGSIEASDEPVNSSEVIDLEKDGPTRPPKVLASSKNNMPLFSPALPQAPLKPLEEDQGLKPQSPFISSQPPTRKIPSLFDIVIEKPILSPGNESNNIAPICSSSPAGNIPSFEESGTRSISKDRDVSNTPGQRPLSQQSSLSNRPEQMQNKLDVSSEQSLGSSQFNNQQSDLPPQAADIAKALQDPSVMQLLTVAIAQAQQSGSTQQNQLLQQLQKLRPLLQMQQDNQISKNQFQFQPQQTQNWQNQNSNNRFNFNDQNRNSFGRNLGNRNEENLNRGISSGNDSDTSDRQQKNPRNPFRRNGSQGNDGNCNNSLGSNSLGNNSLGNNNFGNNSFGNNNFGNNNFGRDPDGPNGDGMISNKANNPFGRQMLEPQRGNNFGDDNYGRPNSEGNDFSNKNFDMGDSRRRNNFEESNFNDFRGGNFGRNNFERENFQQNKFSGSDDFREGGFDEDNYNDGLSSGGGRFDSTRANSNFGTSLGFRNNTNDSNNFRGGNSDDFYRPAQVFDYQNRSRPEALIPQAKVVDYGHKTSVNMPVSSFNRDSSEFVPVKTIDYGHASNSAQKEITQTKSGQTTKNVSRWNQEPESNKNESHPFDQRQPQAVNIQDPLNSNQQQSQKSHEEIKERDEELSPEEELENELQYPKNKWILQNPESRIRPGPPTKRGKRKHNNFKHVERTNEPLQNETECDEIEENFEEISENEEMNDNSEVISPAAKLKGKPLFPSVSDTNKNQPIVFPSMENNNTIPIDEILFQPGRFSRPKNIVIIIRGPPGSGKSHVAKLIKDKEVEMGGQTPRLLSIDDYFMIENDYEEKCPKTGRKIPKKEILYEYEKEAEPTYMQYLIKSFKKTITDHLFDFIIVDCCNQSLRTFNEFYNAARDGNFSPFVIDLKCDLETCLNQNIHNRKEEEIKDIIKSYQDCPGHYIKLDVSNLLENVVEMEDVSDLEDNFVADSEVIELDDEDEEEEEQQTDNVAGGFLKSKWDTDPTTENLARLDGTSKPISKRGTSTIEEYLQIDGWEPPASNTNGKKRVRWADIEEKRAQDKMRAIGFVVGQTDWNRMMDPTSGSGALTKTKYIERYNKRR